MARVFTKEADEILDVKIKVLDKGFVRLVDYMGGDERVVAAARVSFGRATSTPERDALLIDYLMKNLHSSPFEQVILTFHMRLPIAIARQFVRHRTARINEISGRYSKLAADFYSPDEWRVQDAVNKQGSLKDSDEVLEFDAISGGHDYVCNKSVQRYRSMLDDGVANEMARLCVPVSVYTEWYYQMDLHNLFHFLKLRMDSHAQLEAQQYANVMYDIAQKVAPISCAAFKKYELDTVRISKEEYARLKGEIP